MLDRQFIRQTVRRRRQALSLTEQQHASQALVDQFRRHPLLERAHRVALYLANDGELDPRPAMDWCLSRSIKLCLPVLDPDREGFLLFLDYGADTPLLPNRFGIPEPVLTADNRIPLSAIDILFTPLVAFDSEGNRLGMGGGFYDRTLGQLQPDQDGPHLIGLAHDCQRVEQVPVEAWDVPLPEILTPSRRWRWADEPT